MRVMDKGTAEIYVSRNQAGSVVEVQIENTAAEGGRVIRLSREEARRLAALILFQAARLGRPRASWDLPHPVSDRKSA